MIEFCISWFCWYEQAILLVGQLNPSITILGGSVVGPSEVGLHLSRSW